MPATTPSGQRPSLRERVSALRNIPPFLRQIWATSKPLTLVSLGLRLVRALLPIATLYIGKLIIDEAVRLVRLGLDFDSSAPRGTAASSRTWRCCCSPNSRWRSPPTCSDGW